MRSESRIREVLADIEGQKENVEDVDEIWRLCFAETWLEWVVEDIDLPSDSTTDPGRVADE